MHTCVNLEMLQSVRVLEGHPLLMIHTCHNAYILALLPIALTFLAVTLYNKSGTDSLTCDRRLFPLVCIFTWQLVCKQQKSIKNIFKKGKGCRDGSAQNHMN